MVYYKYELRWTSSDNTLREPDASGSFFIEPRPSVSVIFRRSELKKILHTADNLNKQIHIVVMYLFFTTFFTYRNRKRIFHLCSRIGHSIRFFRKLLCSDLVSTITMHSRLNCYPFPLEQLNIDPNSAILLLANVS